MKKLILLCALSFGISLAHKKASLGAFDGFVDRMGTGAHELSRGNTGSADTAALPGAYWNPAILAFKNHFHYSLHAEKRDLDRSGGSLGLDTRIGKRMGIGFAMLYRGDFHFDVINDDDETLGEARPYFTMMHLGFAYRLSRLDAIGISFSMSYDNLDLASYYQDIQLVDAFQSPISFNLGWIRQWNSKWSSSVVIRNLSFSKNLSATWTRNPSIDNSVISTHGFRPKALQVGLGYRSQIFSKPVSAWLEAIDYQIADTLLAFDPDRHVWTARIGFDLEAIPKGRISVGMDGLQFSAGLGYQLDLRIAQKIYPIDLSYALLYESNVQLWSPLSFTIRGNFP